MSKIIKHIAPNTIPTTEILLNCFFKDIIPHIIAANEHTPAR